MHGCVGWLFLMAIIAPFWAVIAVGKDCGKKGGSWRVLGILSSIAIGGLFSGFAHLLFSGEGGSTVLWWIGVVGGGVVALVGILTTIDTLEEPHE